MTKLFIGGLPYSYTNQNLKELFAQFGEVVSASVVTDKFTNQSKGFGFVEFSDDNAAQEAIKNLDGTDLDGRKIGVSVARPKEDRPSNGFRNDRPRNGGREGFNRGGGNRGGGFNRGRR